MRLPLGFHKWTNYEYWPWWFFYLPLVPYWLWLALKTRSLAFFTASNQNIEMGGFFGESKIDILNQIAPEYLPKTFFVPARSKYSAITDWLQTSGCGFPLIAKPNVGERGFKVQKLEKQQDLAYYYAYAKHDFILQEFVHYPFELGVLYCRMPNETSGKVTSVTIKDFLSITGDGKSTIETLMQNNVRARFQIESVGKRLGTEMQTILPSGHNMLLEPIGNHCRGTRFVNGQHLINDQLHEVFNKISLAIDGFHFGRFDLKVASLEDLYAGQHIRIMELNGASSEPGHIYDARFGIVKAYRDLAYHWKLLADICIQNKKKGFFPVSFSQIVSVFKQHFWVVRKS
jgi:hypothetical protein